MHGEERTVKQLPLCEFKHKKKTLVRYDARTRQGPWKFLCKACLKEKGLGVGFGKGQQLWLTNAYLAFAPMRRRSRYIPRSVRRSVIARNVKGERCDPDRHHIDHIWPFSKGGSNIIDNLRVIDKGRNLRKRARRPSIWEMWS